MAGAYFNYDRYLASGPLERRTFLHHWWNFYRRDPHWVPPYYPALRRALRGQDPHLARLSPQRLHLEALPRPRRDPLAAPVPFSGTGGWSRPVAATVLLQDPRRRDGAHTLALLRNANDEETLNRLLEAAATESGARTLFGPAHLSPYLGAGVLASHWHLLPPLHTAYNPPYLPALLQSVMEENGQATLYALPVSAGEHPQTGPGPATLRPFPPSKLSEHLLPLLVSACAPWSSFPPPDRAEAAFVLRWLGQWPLHGVLALVGDEPVGFVLLQPDLAPRLQRAGGGYNLLWRLWLHRAADRPVNHGRLLFGAVLPRWRGRGIGRQLMQAALEHGRAQRWDTITVGPLPNASPAPSFLGHWSVTPRQEYHLYQWQAPPPAFFF